MAATAACEGIAGTWELVGWLSLGGEESLYIIRKLVDFFWCLLLKRLYVARTYLNLC